jgi:hypothetical protein
MQRQARSHTVTGETRCKPQNAVAASINPRFRTSLGTSFPRLDGRGYIAETRAVALDLQPLKIEREIEKRVGVNSLHLFVPLISE